VLAVRWRRLGVSLGDRQVGGRLVQTTPEDVCPGAHQGQLGMIFARREGLQHRLDGLRLPVEGQAERMVGEQPGRGGPVTCRLGVPDGLDRLAMLGEPLGGAPVQHRHLVGQPPAKLQPEQIREQVVVAKPRPLGSSDTTNAFASSSASRIRSEPERPVSRSASSPSTRSSREVRNSRSWTSPGWRSSISASRYSATVRSLPENSATNRSGSG
jgi:hypothetical protein